MKKVIIHKDYKWDKTNECMCNSCWDGGCWFNCAYQEWEKSNPTLDYYQWHRGEKIKKEYELTSRLMTKGGEPDFLMDFRPHKTDFGRRVMMGRFPKTELWLIDFSWSGGIYYDKDKADMIMSVMDQHWWYCTKNDYKEKTELQARMDMSF